MIIFILLGSCSHLLASPFVERMNVRGQILARADSNKSSTLQVWVGRRIGIWVVVVSDLGS
jgi:hypothetical protein